MWISTRHINSVINGEPVNLGDESVKSVERVDPVETFGLFARQSFTVVESDEKCQVLKVNMPYDCSLIMNPLLGIHGMR